MRFEHVYEVDPALMELTGQQDLPAWDTQRIVDSRWEHLDWMHDHFADEVLLAGEGSETMPEEERRTDALELLHAAGLSAATRST